LLGDTLRQRSEGDQTKLALLFGNGDLAALIVGELRKVRSSSESLDERLTEWLKREEIALLADDGGERLIALETHVDEGVL
jgi:hypothetical protein